MENESPSFPLELDIFAFAQTQQELSGQLNVASLPRVAEEVVVGTVEQHLPIKYSLKGHFSLGADGKPELGLTLDMTAVLWLECQRCLGPYEQTLPIHTRFRIVKTESDAEAAPLDEECDVIAGSTQFDLLNLLEDEILLALPIVAKHSDAHPQCKEYFDTTASSSSKRAEKLDEAASAKNPFSVLMNLKSPDKS